MIKLYLDTMLNGNDYLALFCDLLTGGHKYFIDTTGIYKIVEPSKILEYWN